MKKNAMLKIAAILMVAVLLTTCAISSTFAKYTTSKSSETSARVAKWGVDFTTNITSSFSKTYELEDGANLTGDNAAYAVVAEQAVVAPGTTGTIEIDTTVSGTPEVAVRASMVAELTLTGWAVEGSFYCPLVFTINGETYSGLEYEDSDDFEAAVEEAFAEQTADYAVGQSIAGAFGVEASWVWEYEDSNDGAKQTDVKDTALGNANPAPSIALKITQTLTQIN